MQIGVIGAVGDCYSEIEPNSINDYYFKTGSELTKLVKDEANRLRKKGADYIIYLLHEGFTQSNKESVQQVSGADIYTYYDISLSDGYVDLVFEGHTSQSYQLVDSCNVYHLQNSGDANAAVSYAQIAYNTVLKTTDLNASKLITVTEEEISNIVIPSEDTIDDNNDDDTNNTIGNSDKPSSPTQNNSNSGCKKHTDSDDNGICGECGKYDSANGIGSIGRCSRGVESGVDGKSGRWIQQKYTNDDDQLYYQCWVWRRRNDNSDIYGFCRDGVCDWNQRH